MLSIRKEIRISTQHIQEVEEAIKINKESNYAYIIVDSGNLIGDDGIKILLRANYTINPFGEHLDFYHKNYKENGQK